MPCLVWTEEGWSGGSSSGSELGGGIHGGRALASTRRRQRAREAMGSAEGVSGKPLARVMEEQGIRRRAARGGEQGRSSRMAATHGARDMRWGISANS